MKHSRVVQSVLFIAGLILIAVGTLILLTPISFQESGGVMLEKAPSLMSELRGLGGALTALGAIVFSGAFVRPLAFTSALTAAAVYLGYGLSRVFSMIVDGTPSHVLLGVTGLELIVGLGCLFILRGAIRA